MRITQKYTGQIVVMQVNEWKTDWLVEEKRNVRQKKREKSDNQILSQLSLFAAMSFVFFSLMSWIAVVVVLFKRIFMEIYSWTIAYEYTHQ